MAKESGYFIFVFNDTDAEWDKRIKSKKWPVFAKTQFIDKLKKDDNIVFYRGGAEKHIFLGTAKVVKLEDSKEDKFVLIDSIDVWKNPVHIKKIYDRLELIRNKAVYGVYLAGGVKKLSQKDFNVLVDSNKK